MEKVSPKSVLSAACMHTLHNLEILKSRLMKARLKTTSTSSAPENYAMVLLKPLKSTADKAPRLHINQLPITSKFLRLTYRQLAALQGSRLSRQTLLRSLCVAFNWLQGLARQQIKSVASVTMGAPFIDANHRESRRNKACQGHDGQR